MARKQLTDRMRVTPATAASHGAPAPVCRPHFPGWSPARPIPAFASPRACLTSAPRYDRTVSTRSHGATEDSPHRFEGLRRPVETGVIYDHVKAGKDACHDRASGSSETAPPRPRCRTRKDAAGDRAREQWGAVFTCEDGGSDEMRGFGEVVPCPSTTSGAMVMHDIPRDSGAAVRAASGAFLQKRDSDTEVPTGINPSYAYRRIQGTADLRTWKRRHGDR